MIDALAASRRRARHRLDPAQTSRRAESLIDDLAAIACCPITDG